MSCVRSPGISSIKCHLIGCTIIYTLSPVSDTYERVRARSRARGKAEREKRV